MRHSKPKRVTVLGAGMAGLAAAHRLAARSHEVTILETQARIGGRAMSLDGGLAEGLLAEAGPSRFPPGFDRVFRLARELGLELAPFYPEFGKVVAFLHGRFIDAYEPSPEEFWGYTSIRKTYPGLLERSALRLALRARAFLRRIQGKVPWKTYRIHGGAHRLPEALAKATDADLRLGVRVDAVTQSDHGVEIRFQSGAETGTLDADYVVCAVPLSVLRRLRFEPALSAKKEKLATEIPFSSAIRIFLQMKRPYWRDDGFNGFAVTDTVGEVWDPHFDEPREPALLACYAQGALADRLGELDEQERLRHAARELERIFPGAEANLEGGTSICWRDEPWIRGGWPLFRGFGNRVAVFREPEGRVHFAGDYAASPRWLNMMEGTIESGECAAQQIDASA